jgi:hypothetical protein
MTVKRKPGRPVGSGVAITPDKKKEILAILTVGSTRNTAADYVGVGRSTLSETIGRDKEFHEQIKRAEAQGKLRHEKKIAEADAWQASAWHLERKYPEEYALKHKLEHTSPDGSMTPRELTDAQLAAIINQRG